MAEFIKAIVLLRFKCVLFTFEHGERLFLWRSITPLLV